MRGRNDNAASQVLDRLERLAARDGEPWSPGTARIGDEDRHCLFRGTRRACLFEADLDPRAAEFAGELLSRSHLVIALAGLGLDLANPHWRTPPQGRPRLLLVPPGP